jgi:hypothetical protein
MPRLPAATLPRFTRISTLPRTSVAQRHLQTQQKPGAQTVEGESGKETKAAQPKIYSASPPKDDEASEEVRQHNREMDQRADRAAAKVKEEDIEKDKVGKGFWAGQ